MLRLAPTQLALGSRDLSWHTERFNARSAREDQLAKGSVAMTRSLVTDPQESVEQPNSIMPCSFPPPMPARALVATDDSDPALVSFEPVPQRSRVFWDKIMADTGVATGVQVQNVEKRPQVTETPRNSQELVRSSKGSIEEDFPGSTGAYRDAFDISHSQNASDETNTSPQLQSRFSSNSYPSFEADDDDKDEFLVSSNASVAFRQFELPIRSSSMSSSSKGFRGAASQADGTINLNDVSGHTDLDGCSDSVPANQDHQMIEVSMTSEDSEYGTTRSIARTPRIGAGPLPDRSISSENPRLPQLPLPRSIDNFRLRSTSGLPRSRLHISQVAVSSSPEKRPRSSAHSSDEDSDGETIAEPSGLLAVPPRRRKKYKVRNQGYIFDEAALESAQVYGIDRLSIEDRLQSMLPSSLLSSRAASNGSSSESSNRSTNSHSSPSPSPPRTNIASPTLPSRPFSATRRTTSSRLPLSPASPSASNPTVLSLSPSPTSQRMAVYNDNLSAATQPQTPALLPLNGLPAMSLQNPFGIGIRVAQTAPAGMMMGRRRGELIRPMTPTRRGRNLIEDQENLGVEVESRRRRVRETASRDWEWEWDLDGEEQDEGSEAGLNGLV